MLSGIEKVGFTHMPFLAPTRGGAPILLFCASEGGTDPRQRPQKGRIWKLLYKEEKTAPKRLETGLPENTVECSPTAWYDQAGWHVTFIGGGREKEPRYHLYRMDGPSLDALSQPVAFHATRTGFVFEDRLAFGETKDLVQVREPEGDREIELPGAHILRVSYRPDRTSRLLISGQWINEPVDDGLFSLEYDLRTGEQYFLECDGKPAYKCAILGSQIIFAERKRERFEERDLREADRVYRRKVRFAVGVPAGTNGPPIPARPCQGCGRDTAYRSSNSWAITRPSCLECAEKHIGAAYVLLTETADGYAHRLRAVGHLYEAEDESQAWTELHDAIRAARKAYQMDGTMPDWVALEQMQMSIRTK